MLNPKKDHRPLCRQSAEEQRVGIDRRVLCYDWHIPERRAAVDRRLVIECVSNNHGAGRDRRQNG
jgi:hypothetical protein